MGQRYTEVRRYIVTIHCNECLEYHIKTKEGIKTDYVHKIVLMQMVGKMDSSFIQTILGMEKIPDLSEWLAKDIPIRSFKIIEKSYKEESGKRIYTEVFRCVTTLPAEIADSNVVRQIVHTKWGIENNGFKELKDNWYLTHNYHHHPNAIESMFLILFIAYNLFYSYVYRHVKTYRLYELAINHIVEEMVSSYISQKWRMSWVTFDG